MKDTTLEALGHALTGIQLAASTIKVDTDSVLIDGDPVAVIKHFVTMREVNAQIKIAQKSLELLEKHLSHTEIPDLLRARGIKTMTVEGVGRASIGHLWGCSMLDKGVGMNWLRETGNAGLIIETVNSSTLAAFAKDKMETESFELPQDIFKTSITAYTSITKD